MGFPKAVPDTVQHAYVKIVNKVPLDSKSFDFAHITIEAKVT